MRYGIYYRKCDQPVAGLFKEKYKDADISDIVARVFERYAGHAPQEIRGLGCDGNHYAYRVKDGGTEYLFRGDTTRDDDEYMLAESAFMKAASAAGVPVPRVYACDTGMEQEPCRWQLLEWIPGKALVDYDRDKSLNRPAVAAQIGQVFRILHSIPMEGFGFADTDYLKATGKLRGLYGTYAEYFNCRLPEHLAYLKEHGVLSDDILARSRQVFEAAGKMLQLSQAYVVHRDPAFWNMVGEPDKLRALIDWDDAVGGDPADDIGLMYCFEGDEFMAGVLKAYGQVPDDFMARVNLHFLRNMLWKTVIRHKNGYFDKGADFFLNVASGPSLSLYDLTVAKVTTALARCEAK